MALMFNGVTGARQHWHEFECPTRFWVVARTPERDCAADTDTCMEQHTHARICDECGRDMRCTRRQCVHLGVTTHRCTCGCTREYGGAAWD